jgi:hypothetical protein
MINNFFLKNVVDAMDAENKEKKIIRKTAPEFSHKPKWF